jgi:hypothetical protein
MASRRLVLVLVLFSPRTRDGRTDLFGRGPGIDRGEMTKEEVRCRPPFFFSLSCASDRSTNGEAPTAQKSEIKKTRSYQLQPSEDLERPPDIPYQAPTGWPSSFFLPSSPTQPRSVHERPKCDPLSPGSRSSQQPFFHAQPYSIY